MHFRYARHTNNLAALEDFYTSTIGLEKLGSFEDHAGYDGIFLGYKHAGWHLEFTASTEPAQHSFDDDDLLVFYFDTNAEIQAILKQAAKKDIHPLPAKNPYWNNNGHLLKDPDGQSIILMLQSPQLLSNDELTKAVQSKNINDWSSLVEYIRQLPYGRNTNRTDFSLVLEEGKGTCSSKHAFLKKIADLNCIPNVKLVICMYKMTENNTRIGKELSKNGISYIPEAHCYLKLNNRRLDFTNINSTVEKLEADILEEIEIEAEEVSDYKVEYHKNYLKEWLKTANLNIGFDELWQIREQCIANLSAGK